MSEEIEKYTSELGERAKKVKSILRSLKTDTKNRVLSDLALEILASEDRIIEKNKIDLEEGKKKNLSPALMDRLELNKKRIAALAAAVKEIEALPDPVGLVDRGTYLKNGLELQTLRVPLGVVLVIYESRPNVTIDVASLAFKSGNVAILRGGSEALHSNLVLCEIFRSVLRKHNLPEDLLIFVEKTDRVYMPPLLKLTDSIDIVVPRGGEGLIRFVSENSTIPVVKHDKGVCNLFIDASADLGKAKSIAINSKLHRPGVCNATENLIIHKSFSGASELLLALREAGADLYSDEFGKKFISDLKDANEEMYSTEFLDNRLSVKFVDSLREAMGFIEKYSSGHTEAIVSEDYSSIDTFQREVDSAGVFVNCSTRFHDGGEFGLGAEVGISTGKLHVRGPMGLIHLTTTKTILRGNGQILS
ncbi:MAG: glutamate-5-semialdehyde dehydrogenase [Leptospiraceae bacterium]|nr:glutamate-5-semialdehyde dehydrogenase [Leptospiraceae bacterium]MCP5511244.1 glutamate-5-semialdehyde dehydrogenase [Leptospiraceae bacterium]